MSMRKKKREKRKGEIIIIMMVICIEFYHFFTLSSPLDHFIHVIDIIIISGGIIILIFHWNDTNGENKVPICILAFLPSLFCGFSLLCYSLNSQIITILGQILYQDEDQSYTCVTYSIHKAVIPSALPFG